MNSTEAGNKGTKRRKDIKPDANNGQSKIKKRKNAVVGNSFLDL